MISTVAFKPGWNFTDRVRSNLNVALKQNSTSLTPSVVTSHSKQNEVDHFFTSPGPKVDPKILQDTQLHICTGRVA